MTIQRNYSSPNCSLILEGFSNDNGESADVLPILSDLISAQFQIVDVDKNLIGGKDFLVNFMETLSLYTQELLSNVHHPPIAEPKTNIIKITKLIDKNRHLLVWQESKENEDKKIELELTTVQLFDLMETIDQFLADSYTLPDLTLDLKPVSRRYRQAEETFVQQSTPAALGFAGFALIAIAFFFLPMPSQIKDPRLQDEILRENMKEKTEKQTPLTNPNEQNPIPKNDSSP